MPFGHKFDDIQENNLVHTTDYISPAHAVTLLCSPSSSEQPNELGKVHVDYMQTLSHSTLSGISNTELCENNETRFNFQDDASTNVCSVSECANSCSALTSLYKAHAKVKVELHKCNSDNNSQLLDIPVADFLCKEEAKTDDHESFLKVLECLKNAVSLDDNTILVDCSTENEKTSKQESEIHVPITEEALLLSVCEQNNLSKNLTAYDIHQADSDNNCANSSDSHNTFTTHTSETCRDVQIFDHVDNVQYVNSSKYGCETNEGKTDKHGNEKDLTSHLSVNASKLIQSEDNSVDSCMESNDIQYTECNYKGDDETCTDTGYDDNALEIDLNYTDSSDNCLEYLCNETDVENGGTNVNNNRKDLDNINDISFRKEEKDLNYTYKDTSIEKCEKVDLTNPDASDNDWNNTITEYIYEKDLKHKDIDSVSPVKHDYRVIDLTKKLSGAESPERSESPEPGTTHVTISDRIKSLILLKLLSTSTVPQSKSDSEQNSNNNRNSDIADSPEANKYNGYCCKQMAAMAANAHQSTQPVGLAMNNTVNTTSSYSIPVVVLGAQQTGVNSSAVSITTNSSHINLTPVTPTVAQSTGGTFTCDIEHCQYFTNNKNYLKQHVDIVHNADRPYKCPFCGYAGKRSHALREHLIVHSSERPYECKDCNATFRKKGHLTNHIKLHNRKRLVSCPLCKSLVFDQGEQGLDVHLKTAHGTEKLYGCDLCSFIAGNEPEIVKHLNEKHLKINIFKCVKCSFETSDRNTFESHVKTHNLKLQKSDNSVEKTNRSFSYVPINKLMNSATASSGSNVTNAALRNVPEVGQPPVVKPVWIKCTECGFIAQDSEVIRQHMLNHVQVNEQMASHQPRNTETLTSVANSISQQKISGMKFNIQVTAPCNTSLSIANIPIPVQRLQTSLPASTPSPIKQTITIPGTASVPIASSSILVPISDLKQLSPQAANSLDLNSPILVPVSDPAMLKDVPFVKMSSFQYSPTKAPAKYIRVASTDTDGSGNISLVPVIQRSPYIEMNQTPKTSPRSPHTISDVINRPMLQSLPHNDTQEMLLKRNMLPDDVASLEMEEPRLNIVDTDSNKLEASPRLETVVTVSESVSLNVDTGRTETTCAVNTDSLSIASTSGSQPYTNIVNDFKLTEIPVPRNVSIDPPKLPPEILRISEDQHKGTLVRESANDEDDKVATLRASLKNVQQLIQQQEKLQRQLGNESKFLDAKGIPEKQDANNIVYYITPTSKQNTVQNGANVGFTHDSTAGRFRCTICGYTCEYQRTIKAHIWKHSGNKDIDYPMFQNGPLSIYEEEQLQEDNMSVCNTLEEKTVEVSPNNQLKPMCIESTEEISSSAKEERKIPPFIIYEETKISPVAPALAHLIAARTMVGLGKDSKDNTEHNQKSADVNQMRITNTQDIGELSKADLPLCSRKRHTSQENIGTNQPNKLNKKPKTDKNHTIFTQPVNVVVESVNSIGSNSTFTGMASQQNSPGLSVPRSPEETDTCVSEIAASESNASKTAEESVSSELLSAESENNLIIDEGDEIATATKISERRLCSLEMEHMYSRNNEIHIRPSTPEETVVSRKRKLSEMSDQAVTLLSLLKKGPNFNPACPPINVESSQQKSDVQYEDTRVLSQDDVTSTEDSDINGEKPKSGISTSLLAVIEQLRERSKSDMDEDKTHQLPAMTKKPSKRRSRKSSVEDNESALGIGNVEEFVSEGEVKYRCKLCHYANESTVLLRQHMRLHKTKQPFECSLCDFIGESSESLQDHMIQHCKVRTYQCKLCPSAFNYKSQLRAHMRAHNDQDILMCDFCDFETRNQIALKTHMKSHLTNPPYKCEFCREEFITSFNLRLHKREGCNTSIDRFGNYKCDECDFTSLGRREMKNHQRGHSQSKAINQNSKQCPYCKYSAAAVEEVQQHIMDKHGDSKPMKCEMCGFVAVSIRSLKSHMKRHVNDQRFVQQPLEQYKCNLCGYVCHHLPSLKSHMWRHAADQHYSYEFTNEVINAAIDFDCNIEASDTTDEDVEEFRKLIYEKMIAKGLENTRETKEKSAYACCWVTFRCCQCGFETINKAELNRHMNAHSDVIKMTLQVPKKSSLKAVSDEKAENDAKKC